MLKMYTKTRQQETVMHSINWAVWYNRRFNLRALKMNSKAHFLSSIFSVVAPAFLKNWIRGHFCVHGYGRNLLKEKHAHKEYDRASSCRWPFSECEQKWHRYKENCHGLYRIWKWCWVFKWMPRLHWSIHHHWSKHFYDTDANDPDNGLEIALHVVCLYCITNAGGNTLPDQENCQTSWDEQEQSVPRVRSTRNCLFYPCFFLQSLWQAQSQRQDRQIRNKVLDCNSDHLWKWC